MVDMIYAPDSLRQITRVSSTLASGIRVCGRWLSDSDSEDAEQWSLIISSALRHALVSVGGFAPPTFKTLIDIYHKPITQSSGVYVRLRVFSLRPLDPVLIKSLIDQSCSRLTDFATSFVFILNRDTIESISSFDTFAE